MKKNRGLSSDRWLFLTWKTVISALQKESKLLRGIWSSSKLNLEGNRNASENRALKKVSPAKDSMWICYQLSSNERTSERANERTNERTSEYEEIVNNKKNTYFPPKICIPSSEQISINRERSNRRPAMDRMLFNSDATKLLSELQYLKQNHNQNQSRNAGSPAVTQVTQLVTQLY